MRLSLIVVAVVVLLIGIGWLFFLLKSAKVPADFNNPVPDPKTEEKQEIENIVSIDSNLAIGSGSTAGSGSYEEYSQDGVGYSVDKKRVFFFYASWCPTCRPVDSEIKANLSRLPENLAIFRVNYNDPETDEEEKALAQKYGVTYQHTFVQVDKEGNEITKWNGGGLENLLSKIK